MERGKHEDGLLTIVFVGGGPTGVEGAGAHNLIHNVLKLDHPEVDFDRVRLVLINSGARILKGIDPTLANVAIHRHLPPNVSITGWHHRCSSVAVCATTPRARARGSRS